MSLLLAAAAAAAFGTSHVRAELVAATDTFTPGENSVALRLEPEPGWHTYWREPGDVGLPTTLAWTLPAGFTAGEIQWPQPKTFTLGGVTSYGYDRPTLHLVALGVPSTAVGGPATIAATARWLACKDICIPGHADLQLTLPVQASAPGPSPWSHEFEQARASLAPADAPALPAAAASPSLSLVLALALLGGLILNLMPCVFPVLSIKAVSILEARHGSGSHHRAHALAYTAGVLASMLAAALAILTLRSLGHRLGWGFQLQSPVFVALMAYVMFALGLSLSGLVQFGTGIMGVGQSLAARGGLAGSFFTGVLAVVVASPCTAPFMGTALGYALVQPAPLALAVFLVLGLGLALPFLVLGFVPALAAALPRPGRWMETFKEVMAFPLYLTVVWLVWVLARQAGVDAIPVVLSGLLLIALAAWLAPRTATVARGIRWTAVAGALALLALPAVQAPDAAPARSPEARGWEAYSEARLEALRREQRPVLVNLTADWCLTCKFNERVALDTAEVRDALSRRDVTVLRGDWTRYDPAVTRLLERFGRAGVPLYVLYPPAGEPVILPQLLTRDIVTRAIDSLG